MRELLKRLSLAFGPSGCDDRVRDIVKGYIESNMPNGAELFCDINGGVFLHIKNEGAPRLMVSAHMDEVGFMVTSIEENGLLRFGCVGGMDTMVLATKRLVSETGSYGNIIAKPIHLLSPQERGQRPKISDMRIDIGATSREDAMRHTFIGEYFTFDSDYVEYGEGYVKCKALDDRLGCAIMLRAIKAIKDEGIKSKYDLYFAFTTREEIGYSGAFAAAERIKPDYAIVIESKAVADIHGVSEQNKVAILGEGAIISFADRGTLYDHDFTAYVRELCDKKGIKHQTHRIISGGNDSKHIQGSADGCRVALLSAPSRYIHSTADVVHYEDLENIYKALYAVICDD
ncbi:MAG: M20/M25/M40 family metallo-hydrolase [Clostridia bacterium]|nr:M20/M25/M40 family metallo-hydrolase [Clostridia bacterium]